MRPRHPARPITAAVLLAFAPALAARAREDKGPIGGIQTKEFGLGSGYCSPPVLSLSWNAAGYAVDVHLKGITPCPSYPITEHWIVYGKDVLPQTYPLPSVAFTLDSTLYLEPIEAFGPFSGAASTQAIVPDTNLVGTPLVLQAIVGYGTNPATNLLGVSAAQIVVFTP